MKRIISCLLLVTMMLASLLAIIPASAAAATEVNLMYGGLDPNSDRMANRPGAEAQFAGKGNVYYFDYHKYVALGNTFPMTDLGNTDYMIRFNHNDGSGTASVCDGTKGSGVFLHKIGSSYTVEDTGIEYNHMFGYSFKESVIADKIKLYLPKTAVMAEGDYTCTISEIDVYGASVDKEKEIYANEAKKTLLANFKNVKDTPTQQITEGTATSDVIVLEADLNEALQMDYLLFGLKTEAKYKFFEIELNGILAKDSDVTNFNNNALKQQYAIYNEMLKKEEYTDASWTALENAIATTQGVNKNASATAEEITAAAATMKNAIDALVLKEGTTADKTKLNAAVTAAQAKVEADYIPTTWTPFKAALDVATDALTKTNFGTTRLDKIADALTAAMNALKKKADTTALTAKLNEAAGLKQAEYTADSWAALQAAITAANTVKSNVNATQDEVNTALTNLTSAIEALAKPGNNAALKTEVENAKKLKQEDFDSMTALGWELVQMEIANAESVINNPNATQAEIDEALSKLKNQLATLIPKTQAGGEGGEAGGNNADSTTTGSNSATEAPTEAASAAPETEAPQAGGCGSSVAISALAIIGVIGAGIALKKKED